MVECKIFINSFFFPAGVHFTKIDIVAVVQIASKLIFPCSKYKYTIKRIYLSFNTSHTLEAATGGVL